MRDSLAKVLAENHYQHVREVPGQGVCGIYRLMFTTAIFVGLDEWGYKRRYCYARTEDARRALACWSGIGDPSGPWIVEKPSDRQGPGSRDALPNEAAS